MDIGCSKSRPELTAVVVTYQSEKSINETMKSLNRSHEAGILNCIVVDNSSNDSTLKMLEVFKPWAQVLANTENIGFGRGCNLGLALIDTEFVMFINPDSTIEPASVELLIRFMRENSRAQLIAPAITEPGGSVQGVGNLPTPLNIFTRQIPFIESPKHRPVYPGESAFKTDWICGAIMIGRTSFLRELGGFDPRFFLYFEETDLCRRILNANGEIWCVGEAEGYHIGAVSSESLAKDRAEDCIAEFYYQSRYYYLCKHHGLLLATCAELTEVLLLVLRSLVAKCLRRNNFNVGSNRLNAPILSLPKKVSG
jgi:GT2 family glycosyltransferase